MFKIEKHQEYELKFMPNFSEPVKPYYELQFTPKRNNSGMTRRYFSYILVDGKIETLITGTALWNYVIKSSTGFWGTSEGYYIPSHEHSKNKPIRTYYATLDKSTILPYNGEEPMDTEEQTDIEEYVEFTDVVWYPPINLFSLSCNQVVTVKTDEVSGFMRLSHIGRKEIKPVWQEGDDREFIQKLYEGVEPLSSAPVRHKQYMSETYPNTEYLYDEEANKFFWLKRM
jgi:hypothetical protein